ncbi:MAG: response regulator [Lachnospiraceae bacterium]
MKNKRILLAEDNDLNAEITETLLEEQQLKVERVGDGKECLRTLQEMPEEYYDMILMDIQMPVMNGYEAAKAIRQLPGKRGSIPVVALDCQCL